MGMTLNAALVSIMVSGVTCAAGLTGYDKWVRQPRTPRLAVVDVGALFVQAEQMGQAAAIQSPGTNQADAATTEFGPKLQAALVATARQCACTLVAMPAVFGSSPGVPDLTATVRQQLQSAPVGTPRGSVPQR